MSHTYPLPLLTRSIFKKLSNETQIWFPLTKTLNKNLNGSMNLMSCIKFTTIMHQIPKLDALFNCRHLFSYPYQVLYLYQTYFLSSFVWEKLYITVKQLSTLNVGCLLACRKQ